MNRSATAPARRAEPADIALRDATVDDIDSLVAVEESCFQTDRMSRRSFRHALTRGNAATLVAELGGQLVGYAMIFFNRGTSLARLYSIAVVPAAAKAGIGRKLLDAAEKRAADRGALFLRLEVHVDNAHAIRLYEAAGYRYFDRVPHYYEDDGDALRMEKRLARTLDPKLSSVPYYEQTLDFTCGPACLLMAMKALDPETPFDRSEEMRLWREATTIFMAKGHGGSSPFGLGCAARRRGYRVEVFAPAGPALFDSSIRGADKQDVVHLVQEDYIAELKAAGGRLRRGAVTLLEVEECIRSGGIPIVLISSYRFDRRKVPHWVVVTGLDDRFVYVHDPDVAREKGEVAVDWQHAPIARADFDRMARFGKRRDRAAVFVWKEQS